MHKGKDSKAAKTVAVRKPANVKGQNRKGLGKPR